MTTKTLNHHSIRNLYKRDHWVFDMDGTLTHAVHDFEAIRAELGLAPDTMILEALKLMPEKEAERLNSQLFEIEMELARQATPQTGALELLQSLSDCNKQLGILTRNSETLARLTLEACELDHFFEKNSIVGRERCAPKPDPAGIWILMQQWGTVPDNTVMVGDYLFDLQAGRSAGAITVHFDISGTFSWPEYSDFGVSDLVQIKSGIFE